MELVVTIKKKFVVALAAYAVLGVLAWTTLSDEAVRISGWNLKLRTGTLLILGLLVLKSALFYWRTRIEEEQAESTASGGHDRADVEAVCGHKSSGSPQPKPQTLFKWADVAQLVEHSLGKGEVTSSILVIGSRFKVLVFAES